MSSEWDRLRISGTGDAGRDSDCRAVLLRCAPLRAVVQYCVHYAVWRVRDSRLATGAALAVEQLPHR